MTKEKFLRRIKELRKRYDSYSVPAYKAGARTALNDISNIVMSDLEFQPTELKGTVLHQGNYMSVKVEISNNHVVVTIPDDCPSENLMHLIYFKRR